MRRTRRCVKCGTPLSSRDDRLCAGCAIAISTTRNCEALVSNRWTLGHHYCRNRAKRNGYCMLHWRQIEAAAESKGETQ